MSGYLGDLSESQQDSLIKFKQRVRDVRTEKHDDHELLRWLRARSWDLKKAEKMFRDHLIWEKEYDVENILSWEVPEVCEKYLPGKYFGEDKNGLPIIWETVLSADVEGLFYSAKADDIIRYRIKATEEVFQKKFQELSKKHGRRIDEVTMVCDCSGLDTRFLWRPVLDGALRYMNLMEANYPETLKFIFVINAPAIFNVALNLVKPILSDHTKSKIRMLGKDWKTALQKAIDADQIPVYYGGTATGPDGDPKCGVLNNGTVPESYYMLRSLKERVDMSKFTQLNVKMGSSAQLEFTVPKPNSILTWNFWTEGMDIGFGIFRKTSDKRQKAGDMEQVVESKRVNSHMLPENGSFTCENPGTYVVRFDNTYSWLNAKDLSYQIEVVDPAEDSGSASL